MRTWGTSAKRPVRIAWLGLVWPALLLNYFGQGALLMTADGPVENPLFALAPASLLPALVLLATMAAVVASQATISGAFSVTRQAVQLDLLPRVEDPADLGRRARADLRARGQRDHVPRRRRFRRRVRLVERVVGRVRASVIGAMLITTLLGSVVARTRWEWPLSRVVLVFGLFLVVDVAFLARQCHEDRARRLGAARLWRRSMFAGFITWRDGRAKLRRELRARAVPSTALPELLAGATRVPGTAVFLVSHAGFVPTALLRNLEHNHVCHEHVVIMNFEIVRTPRQDRAARAWVEELMPNVHAVHARFGFMETPDVTEAVRGARQRGLRIDDADCTYFVGWHLVRAIERARLGGPQVASVRLSAAAQHTGRRVLSHADEARRHARDRDRHLAGGTAMALYIVQFEDKPNMGELRDKLLKSHFEFLDRVKDRVLVPGSMREVPSDKPLGGLWIIEAKDEAEVRDIFKDDPFWTGGLRAQVRINRWQKAFPDRKVLV